MYIDQESCTGCNACVPYCPVGAISDLGGVAAIDLDNCVECHVCIGFANCPTGAIRESPESLVWPRSLRRQFSDPSTWHIGTDRGGRGIRDIKNNDVTGWVKRGELALGLEMGRPGVGTRLSEVEKVARAMAAIGAPLESRGLVETLFSDLATGEMKPEVRGEMVLQIPVQVRMAPEKLPEVLSAVREVARQVETVISLRLTAHFDDDANLPVLEQLRRIGVEPRPNAKVNLGMGRPLVGG